MDERRKLPRVPLDCPVFVTIRMADGEEVYCLIRDLSMQGAQVALPPGESCSAVTVGDVLTILDPPVQLDGVIMDVRAVVAWVEENSFGISFQNDLSIDQQLLEKLLSDACL